MFVEQVSFSFIVPSSKRNHGDPIVSCWLCQEGDLGDFPPGALALMCLSSYDEMVDVETSIMGITSKKTLCFVL